MGQLISNWKEKVEDVVLDIKAMWSSIAREIRDGFCDYEVCHQDVTHHMDLFGVDWSTIGILTVRCIIIAVICVLTLCVNVAQLACLLFNYYLDVL